MKQSMTPRAPLILMLSGILPFVLSAGAIWFYRDAAGLQNLSGLVLAVYAAVILSFLGGVRWGAEIVRGGVPRGGVLGFSVLGALLGWGLVLAYFNTASALVFAALAAAFVAHWVWDGAGRDLPDWYRRLRLWPTLGAVLSLLAAWGLFGWA